MHQIFRSVLEGFADGFIEGAAYRINQAISSWRGDRIDALCRELGWTVDERDGDFVVLYFSDGAGVKRAVCVWLCNGAMTFCTHSYAVRPPQDIPREVPGYLLARNADLPVGAWSVEKDDAGKIRFRLEYVAPVGGVDAPAFKGICEALIGEVADFDMKLRIAGILA